MRGTHTQVKKSIGVSLCDMAEHDPHRYIKICCDFQPGQHARELNPYWKDGGTGVPDAAPSHTPSPSPSTPAFISGDGGLSWLLKALDRCKQQALDENKSLEEVAAERYGVREFVARFICFVCWIVCVCVCVVFFFLSLE
jgi:hypothetical protein